MDVQPVSNKKLTFIETSVAPHIPPIPRIFPCQGTLPRSTVTPPTISSRSFYEFFTVQKVGLIQSIELVPEDVVLVAVLSTAL